MSNIKKFIHVYLTRTTRSKIKRLLNIIFNPLYLIAVIVIIIIRIIRPVITIRFGALHSEIFGMFAIAPELTLTYKEAGINQPALKTFDIWYFGEYITNKQLAQMWRRVYSVWPYWIVSPLLFANRYIPGGWHHLVPKDNGRDIYNFIDHYSVHLNFNREEELFGETELRRWGVPKGAKFVTILARDSLYTKEKDPNHNWSYHDYRNTDINAYEKAVKFLVDSGYYVFRMGSKVKDKFSFEHQNVFDYAVNGMRNDFMDIYLGAKCEFCLTMGSGWDSIPFIFRRPIVYVNFVPIGYIYSYSKRYITISKKYFSVNENRELTLKEIVSRGLYNLFDSSQYVKNGIKLIENTHDEIYEVVVEMFERLKGNWQEQFLDDELQKKFWTIIPKDSRIHGEIRGRYGAVYLRKNKWWLD
ncbi:TIGR04372 family glycosyltransferase [Leptospira santarosai]|uniref:TIGR04372 family glycosyltransferase n=1 Tax=Leptospira santarosai TaxID=28183 RepID=UPI000958EDFD|nr:TIGR04372 family glycosyltransferase [Leptospira santarosai]OLY63958.1 glycosyltransferase, TIGR04372 family protein [Leptospira santarosai serovar Grippotyphosa]ONF77292.1 glycosyltransferase, TIGR04372 family protein [Leptospira santarosai serovar Bananal]ONF82503.1 glycosyltransferase, TIGR04372 family protein [Leptospira santarosai serovar Grippotyphosa]